MARTSESAKETLQAVIDQLERVMSLICDMSDSESYKLAGNCLWTFLQLEFNEEDEQVFPVLQLFCETVMAVKCCTYLLSYC